MWSDPAGLEIQEIFTAQSMMIIFRIELGAVLALIMSKEVARRMGGGRERGLDCLMNVDVIKTRPQHLLHNRSGNTMPKRQLARLVARKLIYFL